MAYGVFGLNKAYVLNRKQVFSTADTYGWFGGSSSTITTLDRIDFSNDSATASVRGPLSLARITLAATGNSNYGWFGGGFPGPVSIVDRIDFSNDSSTSSVRGPLSSARYKLAATANSNYGWFGAGAIIGARLSTVDRIDFSNDSSTASVRGPLSAVRYQVKATGNSNYGWFGGGGPSPGVVISTVERIDFYNDSATVSARGPLSLARYLHSVTGNSNYGWFGGGNPGPTATVDRIDFSNDSATASVRGPLSLARYAFEATGNSNYGWFGGGFPGPVSIVDRIDFSNDSATASVRGPLSSISSPSGSTSGQAKSSSIRKLKGGNFGWFGGGYSIVPLSITLSTVERIDFSNDSPTASVRGPLSSTRYALSATGNSNYGWFGGGRNPAIPQRSTTTVDRIDFSNDSPTSSVRGPLSLARYILAATGNFNYGWFGGGFDTSIPSFYSRVDRIDFSNDSATASLRGPLFTSRYGLAATGNSNYGWFGGGGPAPAPTLYFSAVDRIDFSNDSATASVRGPLSSERSGLTATGNSNYGWFGGGYGSVTVDRIDFSNDSVKASVRGPLSLGRSRLSATGNSNYGWFGGGGGVPGGQTATVDRIDFSNDSATASLRGPLFTSRYGLAATSNTPIG